MLAWCFDLFFFLIFCLFVCLFVCYIWPSKICWSNTHPVLHAVSFWKSFLKYEWCPWNCKLQFHGYHSYFRKDYQMLLAENEAEIYPPHRALGKYSKTKSKKKNNFKNSKTIDHKSILRCTACIGQKIQSLDITRCFSGLLRLCLMTDDGHRYHRKETCSTSFMCHS